MYTVQSTATAKTLSTSLSSGTAAMSTTLQTSYPAAVVAAPVVITITVSPTATPTVAPSAIPSLSGTPSAEPSSMPSPPSASTGNSSAGGSLTTIIAGAAGGCGFLLLLGLGYVFYRRHAVNKEKKLQILVGGDAGLNYEIDDPECGDVVDDDIVSVPRTRKSVRLLRTSVTAVGELGTPSVDYSGTTTPVNQSQLSITTTTAAEGGAKLNTSGTTTPGGKLMSSITTTTAGGGGTQSIASTAATAVVQFDSYIPKAANTTILPSIDWSALTPSARIGSGSFSAVCKYSYPSYSYSNHGSYLLHRLYCI